ncbi:hypothetical protein RhiirA1_501290 [Rhizophagus irregularis]|uniref:Actin-like ATPase domain-containing protein n=2 Tax=Rhizophagus irregularis TaxID=588596 RepID=A0A2N0QZ33_9GLOM|nr:hypothetical protein RhiirA1_501290 [Rhizophagus irregularis]
MSISGDIRVVVGIDFGTTYSGFSYTHISHPIIITNEEWPEKIGQLKTNTVLKYKDENFEEVDCWGYPALYKSPIELFKLHLGDIPESEKPYLPSKLSYKKAITDYLREIGKLIKKTVSTRWPGIEWHQVLFVMAVPAEFPEISKKILRECAYDANLISNKKTYKLQFTTEPEAAAIYCIDKIPETEIDNYIGRSFLVVDCGGGTVDLTIRKLLKKDELDEVTIRTGDYCGGTCVDQEFIKFLESKVGELAISRLIENHYGKYQYLIQEFCRIVKLSFTGIEEEYKNYELDLEQDCPILKQYITGSKKNRLEDDDWLIGLGFDDVKNMFDPVISKITKLIHNQLDHDKTCSTIFLVGGFSESKYLQERIRKEFMVRVDNIIIPHQPIAAVVRGAVRYGTNKKLIKNRVLKYTYGRSTLRPYNESIDTLDRKRDSGYVLVFKPLARKGTTVEVGQKFFQTSHPENSDQEKMWCRILITDNESARYCDDDGVKELGDFIIDLPDKQLGKDRKVYFELCFGEMEIRAYAKNEYNGNEYSATFNYFDENIAKVADEKFS